MDRANPLETLNEDEVFNRFRFDQEHFYCRSSRKCYNTSYETQPRASASIADVSTGAFQQLIGDSLNKISQPTISRIVRRITRALSSLVKDFIKFPTGRSQEKERSALIDTLLKLFVS